MDECVHTLLIVFIRYGSFRVILSERRLGRSRARAHRNHHLISKIISGGRAFLKKMGDKNLNMTSPAAGSPYFHIKSLKKGTLTACRYFFLIG